MIVEPAASTTSLEHRMRLEQFLAECAARFTAPQPSAADRAIEAVLGELLALAGADRCALVGGTPAGRLSWITCAAYGDPDVPSFGDMNFAVVFPWHFEQVLERGQPVSFARAEDLPAAADVDRRTAASMGVRSMITVPARDGHGRSHYLLVQWLRRDGAGFDALATRLPLLTRVLVNALDRERAEQVRQVETRHEDLLEKVGAIVWHADARTFQTTFVSREAEAILGYPVESWVRVPGFWLDHLHPDDRDWVTEFTRKRVGEQRAHDFEYRMIVADGRTVWLRNIVKVIVQDGVTTGLVGLTVDVTKRKQAEFEAARLRYQLTLANRVTSLGELAATLAHELNQPLGAIVSNAESARLFLDRVPPDVGRSRATGSAPERFCIESACCSSGARPRCDRSTSRVSWTVSWSSRAPSRNRGRSISSALSRPACRRSRATRSRSSRRCSTW